MKLRNFLGLQKLLLDLVILVKVNACQPLIDAEFENNVVNLSCRTNLRQALLAL